MQPEYGLPTGPLASRLKAAGASPVDNPAATYIPAYLSLPSLRLIPELEWTSSEKRFGRLSKRFRFLSPVGTSRGGLCHERVRFQANLKTDVLVFR